MEFAHLETFLVAAELLHFSKAAQRRHLSQSAISQQIRKLELEVGVKLFERGYKHITLTPAGTVFQAEIRKFVELADKAKRRAKRAETGLIGEVRIGFISTAAGNIVPQLISRFRQLRPEVVLNLTHALTATQREMLEKEQLEGLLVNYAGGQLGGAGIRMGHPEKAYVKLFFFQHLSLRGS